MMRENFPFLLSYRKSSKPAHPNLFSFFLSYVCAEYPKNVRYNRVRRVKAM